MTATLDPIDVEITHFHLFCGLGGGARGFNRGNARVGPYRGRYTCLGGIDSDAGAIKDFKHRTGVEGTMLDLFSLEQYRDVHGCEPPPGWQEATAEDVRRAAGHRRPNVVFLSPPCKGFSGLLSESTSKTAKYQALNSLTVRGIWLVLEAWADDPPEFLLLENVPRIASRGRFLLDQIGAMLHAYGYASAETEHDCGELGGLAETRKRFLLVARHTAKIPPFLYEPPKRSLRGVGTVLERLPLPGDPRAGLMHRVPALQWQTWVRLAFVKAGSDWRSLNSLRVVDGSLADYAIVPELYNGAYGVHRWDQPTGVIGGRSGPTNGANSVADPRIGDRDFHPYGVKTWADPSGTVTADARPGSGSFSVADPRPANFEDYARFAVGSWEQPAATVTSQRSPGQGRFSVADPRIDAHPKSVQLGVRHWTEPAATLKTDVSVGTGPYAVPDPRVDDTAPRFSNVFRIVAWDQPAQSVTAGGHPSAGGQAVADPRAHSSFAGKGKYPVASFDEPSRTIIGASSTGHGAYAVADPRTQYGENSHRNKLSIVEWEQPARTITAANQVQGGALSVADPRWRADKAAYQSQGSYGVLPWSSASHAVTSAGQHDNGFWSVADPRDHEAAAPTGISLPTATTRLVCIIRALDNTWHRPFTTLELAAIQDLVDPEEFIAFHGNSDSAWRERIGNAVPPASATAIASAIGTTFLLAKTGNTFLLSDTPIWVQPLTIALSVDSSRNPT